MEKALERIYKMKFESVYPLYVAKVERKGRTLVELNEVLSWLTGFENPNEVKGEFGKLLSTIEFHPEAKLITGVVCGVRVENIEDPILKKVRLMDKIVDELAKGKSIEKIKRKQNCG
ncbi:DUF2200 family protein [Lactococcus fujiensis]|uniref:DUF2200 domain-containing protein n=1 Tax=Lactococcus fujiensis JCM 16395 TaxID=1291764 RepID=A0A2A5RQ46_9LACT|nr:DUF2200 family protein [Lactococcus fujiensis]PCS01546.1 hypothetical protein RT41_GL000310 [Lactococcus fujiensis JCM 16395]